MELLSTIKHMGKLPLQSLLEHLYNIGNINENIFNDIRHLSEQNNIDIIRDSKKNVLWISPKYTVGEQILQTLDIDLPVTNTPLKQTYFPFTGETIALNNNHIPRDVLGILNHTPYKLSESISKLCNEPYPTSDKELTFTQQQQLIENHKQLMNKREFMLDQFVYTNMNIYFSYVYDKRGRIYCRNQELNYQGSKNLRAMLFPTTEYIHLDAIASGVQILSALSRDINGCKLTGLIESDHTDPYMEVYKNMGVDNENITRKKVKYAVMTSLYGSKAVPKQTFGNYVDTFYKSLQKTLPGACDLLEKFSGYWNPNTKSHEWYMPDGFHVSIPVIVQEQVTCEYSDEHWGDVNLTLNCKLNKPSPSGISLPANITHSIDGFICREIIRYSRLANIKNRLAEKFNKPYLETETTKNLLEVWKTTKIPSLAWFNTYGFKGLPSELIDQLMNEYILIQELEAFYIYPIHDCFIVKKEHGKQLKRIYNNILANISDGNMVSSFKPKIGYQIRNYNGGIVED